MVFKILIILAAILPCGVLGGCARMKRPKELQDCYDQMNKCDEEQVGELAVESCLSNYYWKTTKERWHLKHDNKTIEYFDYLWDKYTNDEMVDDKEEEKKEEEENKGNQTTSRRKRQVFPGPRGLRRRRCIRKEVRQLTRDEWRRTYQCINRMKRDTRLFPNVYEAIARIHNGESAGAAHGGQAFLPWHTIYMLLLEFSLRECDQSLCLPYWDSRLDAELSDPRDSVFFWLVGGANGPLSFPFNGWTYNSGGGRVTVVRNARDSSGMLIDYSTYNRLMSARSTSEMSAISSPSSRTVIEGPHNALHTYLRGTVVNLVVAAQDIIFFMLHGFIECIFERNLRSLRPRWRARVYPRGPYRFGHGPTEVMGVLGWRRMNGARVPIRNREGFLWRWRRYFRYYPSPTCRNGCRTPENYLQCCNGRCVSKIFNGGVQNVCQPGRRRGKRQAENITTEKLQTSYRHTEYPIMNDFVLDGVPDSSLWVYVAVSITHVRAHEDSFQCYSVKNNGGYDNSSDIYDPSRYSSLNKTLKSGYAKPLKKCKTSKSGSSYVFVRTDGINYSGHYEDYAIVDNRLPVFKSEIYVAIKKPSKENTNVIFSAYDACGRVCKPFCPDEKTGYKSYEPCNGILSVDNKPPRLYGNTLGEAVLQYWDFSSNTPSKRHGKKYCMHFLCDGLTSFSKQS